MSTLDPVLDSPPTTSLKDLPTSTMSERPVYLAKYNGNASRRAHFALFIPYALDETAALSRGFTAKPCKGTIIHVVGEPVMSGFALQFKRNYDCSTIPDLQELVHLGYVQSAHLFKPADADYVEESTPRAVLEREAARVSPPLRG